MVKPIMLFGNTVRYSYSRENIEKISKLQKRAACVILEAHSRGSSDSLSELNWLTSSDEMKIRKCCLIYRRIRFNSKLYK